jgi:hypothetical protein
MFCLHLYHDFPTRLSQNWFLFLGWYVVRCLFEAETIMLYIICMLVYKFGISHKMALWLTQGFILSNNARKKRVVKATLSFCLEAMVRVRGSVPFPTLDHPSGVIVVYVIVLIIANIQVVRL